MKDQYKHDVEGVASLVTSLTGINNEYRNKILEIKNLIKNIDSSVLWKDATVKTEFINTCNSYIKIYESIANKIESYLKYLAKKSGIANDMENNYSKPTRS